MDIALKLGRGLDSVKSKIQYLQLEREIQVDVHDWDTLGDSKNRFKKPIKKTEGFF